MWQVLVMVCFLTEPCQYFVESTPKLYPTRNDCLEVANSKAVELSQKFEEGGYTVVHSQYTCIEDAI